MEAASSGAGGDDHLHGLKFGKKIYFEDAAGGSGGNSGSGSALLPHASPKSAGGASSSSAAPAPARCQVEGCNEDLSGAKNYYFRHKVCIMHAKTPRVIVAGLEQRFCQQCSRFHLLPEFDQGKRSCRRRLAGHNERRRKPPPGPLASRYGRLAASFGEEPSRFRSFLLDFSYPRVASSIKDGWPAVRPAGERVPGSIQWQASLDLHHHHSAVVGYGAHSYDGSQGSSASATGPPMFPGPELPPGSCLAGVPTDDSFCALSLLSTQPWDTTHSASHSRAPTLSATAGFDGNYTVPSPWTGPRGPEGGQSVPPQLPTEAPLDKVPASGSRHHGQLSGELELALQGNGPAPWRRMDHGSPSTFNQAGNTMDWSL